MWSVKWCHFHWPWVTSKFLLPPHGNVVETLLDGVYIWKFTDISVCFPRSVCQKYRLYTSDTRARLGSAKASLATTTASLVFALICRQPAIDSPYIPPRRRVVVDFSDACLSRIHCSLRRTYRLSWRVRRSRRPDRRDAVKVVRTLPNSSFSSVLARRAKCMRQPCTLLLVTLPNIHQFKKNHSNSAINLS